jgi:hypothetical protein
MNVAHSGDYGWLAAARSRLRSHVHGYNWQEAFVHNQGHRPVQTLEAHGGVELFRKVENIRCYWPVQPRRCSSKYVGDSLTVLLQKRDQDIHCGSGITPITVVGTRVGNCRDLGSRQYVDERTTAPGFAEASDSPTTGVTNSAYGKRPQAGAWVTQASAAAIDVPAQDRPLADVPGREERWNASLKRAVHCWSAFGDCWRCRSRTCPPTVSGREPRSVDS